MIEYEYLASDLKTVRRRTSDRKCLYEHVYSERDLSGNLLQERCIGDRGVVTYTLDPLSRRSALQAPHFSQQVLAFDTVGNVRKMSPVASIRFEEKRQGERAVSFPLSSPNALYL